MQPTTLDGGKIMQRQSLPNLQRSLTQLEPLKLNHNKPLFGAGQNSNLKKVPRNRYDEFGIYNPGGGLAGALSG